MCRELSDLKDTTVLFTFCVERAQTGAMGQVLGRAPLLPVARHYVNGLRTSVEFPPSPFADTHARAPTRYLPQSQARACTTYGMRSMILQRAWLSLIHI